MQLVLLSSFVLALASAIPARQKRQAPPPQGDWGHAPPESYYAHMGPGGEMPREGQRGPPPKKGAQGGFRGQPKTMAEVKGAGGPKSGRPQPSGRESTDVKPKAKTGQHSCAELDLIWLWPDATMVYSLNETLSDECRTNITEAMADVSFSTDNYVLFREKTAADKDWVNFDNKESGCTSELGRIGGYQYTNLGVGCCAQGTVVHEILHNLGFNHMHTRQDRDDYVTVVTDNIKAKYRTNFVKYNSSVTLLGSSKREFDYNSIMMYPTDAFANKTLGNETLVLPEGVDGEFVGQRDAMTDTDVGILQDVYAKCYEERRAKTGEATVSNFPEEEEAAEEEAEAKGSEEAADDQAAEEPHIEEPWAHHERGWEGEDGAGRGGARLDTGNRAGGPHGGWGAEANAGGPRPAHRHRRHGHHG